METKKITSFLTATLFSTAMVFAQTLPGLADKSTSINNVSSASTEKVYDIDGNEYNTVVIGTQIWLVENLKTTKYRNGDLIGTTDPANLSLASESSPKYQWAYGGNANNVATYGRLYTWYAATDSRNIAPEGYRVPTDQDLITLATYLIENGDIYSFDGQKNTGTVTAGNMITKSLASTTGWTSTTKVGTPGNSPGDNNASGFNAQPGGYRGDGGGWNYGPGSVTGRSFYMWTTTEATASNARSRWFHYNTTDFITRDAGMSKKSGLSIRCIKDDTTTSIQKIQSPKQEIKLMPNRVETNMAISFFSDIQSNAKIEIITLDSKTIAQYNYSSVVGANIYSVDLSNLAKGIYICRVSNNKLVGYSKFMKI